MTVCTYPDAPSFLEATRRAFEAAEAANCLMLGVCLRLAGQPERIEAPLCFRTVEDGEGLVLAAVIVPPWKMLVLAPRGGEGRDLDAAARMLVAHLLGERWPLPGVEGPAAVADLVAGRLAEATGRTPRVERHQVLYELRAGWGSEKPDRFRPAPVRSGSSGKTCQVSDSQVSESGHLRLAAEADAPLIARWWYGSDLAAFGQADAAASERTASRCVAAGDVYVWDVGRPVSMAGTTAPTYTGITVARVYTPPEERGRGYATACVTELSRRLLASGRAYCTLFVEASNHTARRVYERVGYRAIGEYHEIALEE